MTPPNTSLAQLSQLYIDKEYYVLQKERIEKKIKTIDEKIEEVTIKDG